MTTTISISEARESFAEITNRVQYGRERIDIQKHGKTVAVLLPVEDADFLEQLEDRALGELAAKRLAEFEKDPVTFTHEEVFGTEPATADAD